MELYARNVNEALALGAQLFLKKGANVRSIAPRGKPTLEITEPVITIYICPWERVLFSKYRDANPYLHLFESLWLLAGRSDVAFVEFLNKRFADYSDDGVKMQGSYGLRWREYGGLFGGEDQLKYVIELLKKDHDTRRAVLSMWHPSDLWNITSKDIPCNTHVYFKIRDKRLSMTVCCRSNDMIWGAYGANAVQFSILHEYVADKLGVGIGFYNQISDSFHVYTEGAEGEVWQRVKEAAEKGYLDGACPYSCGGTRTYPLGAEDPAWDEDMKKFFAVFDSMGPTIIAPKMFGTPWWAGVAQPMWNSFITRNKKAAQKIIAQDWELATTCWLDRHAK